MVVPVRYTTGWTDWTEIMTDGQGCRLESCPQFDYTDGNCAQDNDFCQTKDNTAGPPCWNDWLSSSDQTQSGGSDQCTWVRYCVWAAHINFPTCSGKSYIGDQDQVTCHGVMQSCKCKKPTCEGCKDSDYSGDFEWDNDPDEFLKAPTKNENDPTTLTPCDGTSGN